MEYPIVIKKSPLLRTVFALGGAVLLGLFFLAKDLFDLKLAITLAIVEVPLLMFGSVIASIILDESRKHAKEIGEEVGKQLKTLPKDDENQKHIDDHCGTLIERYVTSAGRVGLHVWTELELYNKLPDKEQLLQHFHTGHEELLYFLKQSVDLEKIMKSISKPISEENQALWKTTTDKYNEVHDLYKKKMQELLGQINRKSTQLGGICNECKKWHDSKSEDFKKLEMKLNSFTMPF